MVKVRIKVTQEDIDKGVQSLSDGCPVALALNRVGLRANVDRYAVTLTHKGSRCSGYNKVKSTDRVSHFVSNFDDYGRSTVKPFSFLLLFKGGSETNFTINPDCII